MRGMVGLATRLLLLMLLGLPTTASAGELGDFQRLVASAYAPYRSALYYLRTENFGVAALELQTAGEAWRQVVDRFVDAPPDAFSEDTDFVRTLISVRSALDDGMAALDRNDQAMAEAVLDPIRESLSALRRRNGLRTFSDCIDEMNAAMDRLWAFRHEPPAFDQTGEVNRAKSEAAVTLFLYQKCHDQAPADLEENPEFKRLFDGSLQSLPLIFETLDRRERDRLINILRELRSFDRMIWLKFG